MTAWNGNGGFSIFLSYEVFCTEYNLGIQLVFFLFLLLRLLCYLDGDICSGWRRLLLGFKVQEGILGRLLFVVAYIDTNSSVHSTLSCLENLGIVINENIRVELIPRQTLHQA